MYEPDDLVENVHYQSDEIFSALLEIEDLGPLGAYGQGTIGEGQLQISVPCDKCSSSIYPVNVVVRAEPVYCDHENKMPSIDFFEPIIVRKVLPASEVNACFSLMEQFEFSPLEEYCPTAEEVELLMIVKTRMNNGYCFIGFDIQSGELVRPILRTASNMCCWRTTDPELQVGKVYRFQVCSRDLKSIPFPHRNNDVQVHYLEEHFPTINLNLFDILVGYSHPRVKDVFMGANIVESRYINEDTNCRPSVGIYRCSGKCVTLNRCIVGGKIKTRCAVKEGHVTFSFPFTSLVDHCDINDQDLLLILGLARPFKGSKGEYSPMRCYILVLGIISQSTPINQEAAGQQAI